uniref:LAGLIDADG endonuclease n=1 Tax=Metarhizium rileyi (strain RCEF 4871) TaxID=1649241 RepID=A0A6H0B8S2_METRR|nr:LAGLIDADG endonuclease [Metarhizium rileyi]QIS49078.1 LAGLIDADG endonuclease [Metarhizium rileyi]
MRLIAGTVTNMGVKRSLFTKVSCRKLHSSPNQQERLNKLVQDENYKFWLGGFVEGEGSLVVSLVKNPRVTHGLALQPEFNVVQHENGIDILYSLQAIFEAKGSVHKKSGSQDVWVYSLKGTQNLHTLVLPFFNKYVITYSSKFKGEVFYKFSLIINKLNDNRNKTFSKEEIIDLIKLVYSYNPDTKGKSRKRTLQETIDIINQNT